MKSESFSSSDVRRRRKLKESTNPEILQMFEDFGFYSDNDGTERYFFDDMPSMFRAVYYSDNQGVYIDWDVWGNSYEVYGQDVSTVSKADSFLSKLYNWCEYNESDLIKLGLKALGFREDSPWEYSGKNQFDENVKVDLYNMTVYYEPEDETYEIWGEDGLAKSGILEM